MSHEDIQKNLIHKGVKPTANRIIVYESLAGQNHPVSIAELEDQIVSMDKSSIFRVLSLFIEKDVVHSLEDGSGSEKYELCTEEIGHSANEGHVHFYCESCKRTFCIDNIEIPSVNIPKGFSAHSTNYMIKGICPECNSKLA